MTNIQNYKIDENFDISSDSRQYILKYKEPRKKIQRFYFAKLKSLCRFVVELKLKQSLGKRFIKNVSFPKALPYIDKESKIEQVLKVSSHDLQLVLEDNHEG